MSHTVLNWAAAANAEIAELRAENERLRAENERLRADRLKLDRRIHNQRRALRENWEIVEMRRKWLGSDTARRMYCNLLKRFQKLRAENAWLRLDVEWARACNKTKLEKREGPVARLTGPSR